jgi:hypothetical protein
MEIWETYQLFGSHIRGRISPDQPQIYFLSHRSSLSKIAVFSKPIDMQKVVEPEPFI